MKRHVISLISLSVALAACSQVSAPPTDAAASAVSPPLRTTAANRSTGPTTEQSAHVSETVAPSAPSDAPVLKDTEARVSVGCPQGTSTLFSCQTSGRKTAALCMRGNVPDTTFYRFGTSTRTELRYPADDAVTDGKFHRTTLSFAGATGGYAYSFHVGSTVYALYSVSGNDGLARAGVTVLDASGRKVANLPCALDTLEESESIDVIRATRSWPQDPVVAKALQ